MLSCHHPTETQVQSFVFGSLAADCLFAISHALHDHPFGENYRSALDEMHKALEPQSGMDFPENLALGLFLYQVPASEEQRSAIYETLGRLLEGTEVDKTQLEKARAFFSSLQSAALAQANEQRGCF